MSWQPILDGELAERATRALRRIAIDLTKIESHPTDLAMFWAYVASVFGDEFDAAHVAAMTRLEAALEQPARSAALYGDGLAGLGWTVAHCADDADVYLEIVDQQLVDALVGTERWPADYDLINGLAGFAVYFLERGDAPLARTGLDAVVDHLDKLAERRDGFVTWHTPLELLPGHEQSKHPTGWYNCGLAHGVPGVIGALARICARPDSPPRATELRDGAIRWMLAQRTADPERSRFPTIAYPDHSGGARTAWCYGDPGVIIALWDAAARSGESTVAMQLLALAAMSRTPEQAGVRDAPLCHGSAGLAHMCNRFFHASGDVRFRELAQRWFAHALDFERADGGIGGFFAWRGGVVTLNGEIWQAMPDFLDGISGVGLALASALTPMEPEWDRLLLCDLTPLP